MRSQPSFWPITPRWPKVLMWINPATLPNRSRWNDDMSDTPHAPINGRPIGGWLWLLAIGVVINPFRSIILLWPLYSDLFQSGAFQILSNPENPEYISGFWSLILAEILINFTVTFVLFWQFLLFFQKKKLFKIVFICTNLFTIAFILVDSIAVKFVFPQMPLFNSDTLQELARSLVVVLIWVPYLLFSERVKETFVN